MIYVAGIWVGSVLSRWRLARRGISTRSFRTTMMTETMTGLSVQLEVSHNPKGVQGPRTLAFLGAPVTFKSVGDVDCIFRLHSSDLSIQ